MNLINIKYNETTLHIEVHIPKQPFVILKYGTIKEPLPDYLPIKILPLDCEGFGEYDLPSNIMIPENATHIWVNEYCTPIPNKQSSEIEIPQLIFYTISDIHTISKGGKQLLYQKKAFQHIANANPAFVIIAGDITNGTQAQEFSLCSQQIKNNLADIPIFATFGNHDFHPNHAHDIPDHDSRIHFQNWLYEQNLSYGVKCDTLNDNYYTCINRIHIISMQGMDFKNSIYSVGDDVLSWLDATLASYAGERQIVFSHYPITNDDRRIFLRENKKLKQILEKYENVLYFAGHTHDSLDSNEPSIRQNKGVTYINTASVGNTEPCTKDTRVLKPFRNKMLFPQLEEYFCRRSMGIRVEVYHSYFIIRGVDFIQDKYIPRCMARINFSSNEPLM